MKTKIGEMKLQNQEQKVQRMENGEMQKKSTKKSLTGGGEIFSKGVGGVNNFSQFLLI